MHPRHSKESPRRLRAVFILTLLVFAGGAQAHDAIVTPPQQPRPIAQTFTRRITDEEALQALQEAKDARTRANCMLSAARKVDSAALQLDRARPEHRDERQQALYA